ncbi:IS3 family transposase [Streptomyces sp. NPDC101152]|uniref:IS3 family transposase n=1 Tax=Streptomyces sp. NPDC101152 TaxID=3366116 RepID=UPI003817E8BA
MAVGVISICKAEEGLPHRVACRALGVSESWYYKWRRPPIEGEMRRQHPAEEIEEIFRCSGGTYGSPKVFIELGRRGWRVSVKTVAKLMAELGLAGRKVKRRRSLTAGRSGLRPSAADARPNHRHCGFQESAMGRYRALLAERATGVHLDLRKDRFRVVAPLGSVIRLWNGATTILHSGHGEATTLLSPPEDPSVNSAGNSGAAVFTRG